MLLVTMLLALQVPAAWAQSARVTGKVTSTADNQGIPGASVVVKGTTTGTTTNADGEFTLDAAADAVLVISYIGFTTEEVPVAGKSRIEVTLAEDIKALSEVVVVGYGEMRRSDLTSAQTTVTAKEIEKTVNTTIEQAIQGRAAGVYVTQNTGQPGGGVSVNIRGLNSITGANEPLYVIDGVQIQSGNVQYGTRSSTNPLAGL
ncbi:MAG: carboxypeptidase-like regulatory domain-containing protein, partial [Cytophagales bacterium]|nr:carboxypeptidase-like regulatory domain-containing protein [Cytophagales bacterium]